MICSRVMRRVIGDSYCQQKRRRVCVPLPLAAAGFGGQEFILPGLVPFPVLVFHYFSDSMPHEILRAVILKAIEWAREIMDHQSCSWSNLTKFLGRSLA